MLFAINSLFVDLRAGGTSRSIDEWDMSLACAFEGNDLSNVSSAMEYCLYICIDTPECTHFVWNDGTCWMKKGYVTLANATRTQDGMMMCGAKHSSGIWKGNSWAMSCNFTGNDLSNVRSTMEDCGWICAESDLCTHYVWAQDDGGTCWLKKGPISKAKAFRTNDPYTFCGVLQGNHFVQIDDSPKDRE